MQLVRVHVPVWSAFLWEEEALQKTTHRCHFVDVDLENKNNNNSENFRARSIGLLRGGGIDGLQVHLFSVEFLLSLSASGQKTATLVTLKKIETARSLRGKRGGGGCVSESDAYSEPDHQLDFFLDSNKVDSSAAYK